MIYFHTKDLSVGYNGHALIHDINIEVEKGKILTLIGPNGAGKSTILKSITRHLAKICGQVYIDRQEIYAWSARELAKQVAVVLTDRIHPELMTCEEVVAMGRYPYTNALGKLTPRDKEIVVQAMERVHALDLAQQDFSLLKMSDTDAYYPTYDLVFACHRVTVGAEDLDAALKRVVAGLKVALKDKDNQVLSTEITNVEVRVTNIYEKLNAYTAEPHGDPCTVSFPLVRSADGLQMSNGIVMLFPSAGIPELQLNISLADGQVKHISQQLKQPLEANNKLTLTISIGDIFEEEGSGSITVDEWNENHEEIDVPVLQ